jgi:acyl-CoA carboxylase subunit beta
MAPATRGDDPAPRLRAEEWADTLLDAGTAEELVTGVRSGDPLGWPGYPELKQRAPGEESVRVYRGEVRGQPCVLVAFDFAHIGGSVGAGTGERVYQAFMAAKDERLPVVTVAATGGSRMQEGMVALVQMIRMMVAVRAHAEAGLLHVGIASDPTTGGVYASFLSQADVLVTEPGAYIGFAGPRVAASLGGSAPKEGVNRAEFALQHGLVDAIVERYELAAWVADALAATAPPTPRPLTPVKAPPEHATGATDASGVDSAWSRVLAARAYHRPMASDLIVRLDHVVRMHGDRAGGTDPDVLAVLARLEGRPIAVAGLDRHNVTPAGYRTIWRLFRIAERLGLPLVTLVDTPGADPGPESEAAGQARSIGETLSRMLTLPVPTVAAVIGEGGSGGAVALSAADRLLVQRTSVFSVIAPEGAAAILHRDAERAPEVAELQKLTADDLVGLGIAHRIVPDDPDATLHCIAEELDALVARPAEERQRARIAHWTEVGGSTLRREP